MLAGVGLNRRRPSEIGALRAADIRRWVGRDLRILRVTTAQSQRRMASRCGISQSFESQVERGIGNASLEVLAALAEAGGGKLVVRIVPGDGVSLRDSGQLEIVQLISTECHDRWRRIVEMPVGEASDRRAADLVVQLPEEVNLVEVERAWVDHQAQYRNLQLKRTALSQQLGRPVNLIIALVDTERTRRALTGFEAIIRETLPVPSRRIWACLRSGTPIGGDGILWVRPAHLRSRRLQHGARGADAPAPMAREYSG